MLSRVELEEVFFREEFAMKLRNGTLLGTVLLIGASPAWSADTAPETKQAAEKLAAEVCSTCHQSQKQGNAARAPALMGQQKSYLAWQLRAYRLGFRDDPQAHDRMWNPAGNVDEALIDALAEYYASQPPTAGKPGDAVLIERGKELYENGIPSKSVAGCSYCHGENGEGNGIFPRLAGQCAGYLVREISLIQKHLRNIGIMHSTVEGLSADDLMALGAFLQAK